MCSNCEVHTRNAAQKSSALHCMNLETHPPPNRFLENLRPCPDVCDIPRAVQFCDRNPMLSILSDDPKIEQHAECHIHLDRAL